MNDIIMWIMAVGALLGGLDLIFGNRFGLGKKFQEGFGLLGPMGLSMVGIICMVPLLSKGLGVAVAPLCTAVGIDPSMFGGILALDMGGFQLCEEMAVDPLVGRYAGIVVGAVFGCTISFTIPVGMGVLEGKGKEYFSKGILFGLITMPTALVSGGLLCGMTLGQTLWNNMPILVMSALLLLGLWKAPGAIVKGFSIFAEGIRIVTIVGLAAAAFTSLTGVSLIPGLAPIEEGMEIISSIGIVLLGSMPIAELLQRALKKPLALVGQKTGMNSASVAGMLVGMFSITAALAMLKDMDNRGRVVNAAFFVSVASALAGHLGFAAGVAPDMMIAMVVSKLIGGGVGIVVGLLATRNMAREA